MPDCPVADIRLSHLLHGDCCLNPHIQAQLFQAVRHTQSVDHRCQHPHMVGSGTVHFPAASAPPEIAAANYNRHFRAHIHAFLYGLANFQHRVKINAMSNVSRKRFSAEFEQDTLVFQCHAISPFHKLYSFLLYMISYPL